MHLKRLKQNKPKKKLTWCNGLIHCHHNSDKNQSCDCLQFRACSGESIDWKRLEGNFLCSYLGITYPAACVYQNPSGCCI